MYKTDAGQRAATFDLISTYTLGASIETVIGQLFSREQVLILNTFVYVKVPPYLKVSRVYYALSLVNFLWRVDTRYRSRLLCFYTGDIL
jgi:hypothetical protein